MQRQEGSAGYHCISVILYGQVGSRFSSGARCGAPISLGRPPCPSGKSRSASWCIAAADSPASTPSPLRNPSCPSPNPNRLEGVSSRIGGRGNRNLRVGLVPSTYPLFSEPGSRQFRHESKQVSNRSKSAANLQIKRLFSLQNKPYECRYKPLELRVTAAVLVVGSTSKDESITLKSGGYGSRPIPDIG